LTVPITYNEVRKAIANDKAAGIDSIQAELINAGDETAVATLTELCNKVWDTEIVPDDWKDSVIVIVPLPVENRHFRLTLLYGINVKKLQFIHKLTASDTSKTAKITKR